MKFEEACDAGYAAMTEALRTAGVLGSPRPTIIGGARGICAAAAARAVHPSLSDGVPELSDLRDLGGGACHWHATWTPDRATRRLDRRDRNLPRRAPGNPQRAPLRRVTGAPDHHG